MAKIMNDNFQINVGNPIDSKYLNSTNQPYTNTAAAIAAVPQSQRYVGLTVNVANVEYWWHLGVTDGDLVIKDSGIASTGITTAINGLTKVGNAVKLGGTLTGSTLITDSRGTPVGIQYGGDYSSAYTARSLVDAGYVTGYTNNNFYTKTQINNYTGKTASVIGGAITGATNGLTKIGRNAILGGTLTGDTTIDAAAKIFTVCNSVNACLYLDGSYVELSTDGGNAGFSTSPTFGTSAFGKGGGSLGLGGNSAPGTARLSSSGGSQVYLYNSGNIELANLSVFGGPKVEMCKSATEDGLVLQTTSSNDSSITLCGVDKSMTLCASGITVYPMNDKGIEYYADLSATFVDNSLITKKYVCSQTSGVTANAICTANNGLTKQGKNVRLGGALTGATVICGAQSLSLGCAGSALTALNVCAGSATVLTSGNVCICPTGTLTLDGSDICVNQLAKYDAEYCASYVARSIPDVNFVTGCTNSIKSNYVCSANNGLTKSGTNVRLGGALTGNTCVSGSYVFTLFTTTNIITGASTCIGGTTYLKTPPAGSGGLLCISPTTGQICQTSLSTFGGVTGGTNGITACGNQQLGLGGTLCANTQINGPYKLTLGALQGITLRTSGTCAVTIDAHQCGAVILKSQSGDTLGNNFCNAVGIYMDYDAPQGFTIYDNRPVGSGSTQQTGIQYAADYSLNYVSRSLVDKQYVDSIATGLNVHAAVYAATTSGITLSGAPKVIDGVSVPAGQRVLVKNQSSGATNGIYIVTGGTWQRASDYDGTPSGEVSNGDLIPVTSGMTQNNQLWALTTLNPITVGVTPLTFSLFSTIIDVIGGPGIDVTMNGGVHTVCVALGSNSGLNTTNGLVVDSSIAGNGLSLASGILNVNAASCGSAPAIPVGYNAGDCLVVACADITTALGTPINSAVNGLTKDGNRVLLGGSLTGATNISVASDSCSFTFTDTAASKRGVCYAGDYSADFVDRSLVTKYFVNNAITGGTGIAFACNGLTKVGNKVVLGGNLTGTTNVFNVANSCLGLGWCAGVGGGANGARILIANGTAEPNKCVNISSKANSDCTEINVATTAMTLNSTVSGFMGATYGGDYSANFVDNSLVTKKFVCSQTSGITTTAITGATNGLTKIGQDVCLGGDITAGQTLWLTDCQIFQIRACGVTPRGSFLTLGTNDSVPVTQHTGIGFSSCSGGTAYGTQIDLYGKQGCDVIRFFAASGLTEKYTYFDAKSAMYYGGDYEADFLPRTLVTKQYVDNQITGGTAISAAGNGLTKNGNTVDLGGSLTGITTLVGPYDFCIDVPTKIIELCGFGIQMAACSGGTVCSTITVNPNFARLDNYNNSIILCNDQIVIMDYACSVGAVYGGDYEANFVARSLVTAQYVTGITSQGITLADNGLTKVGETVVLGGTLTGNTLINLAGNAINIGSDTATGTFGVSASTVTISSNSGFIGNANNYMIVCSCGGAANLVLRTNNGVNGDCLDIVAGNTLFTSDYPTTPGIQYGGDYEANFVARSLVTAQYVTGITTNSISLADNGLTKVGNTVVLGGTLTGNTQIIIPNNMCLDLGAAYNLGCRVGLILDATNSVATLSSFDSGTHTGFVTTCQDLVQIAAISGSNSTSIVVGSNYIELGDVANSNDIMLDATGVNITSATAINLGSTGYPAQVYICAPISAGTISDSVIVRNAATGELKTVAGSSLGDKNNIYSKTLVTGATSLTTGSSYVILANSTVAAFTITLPQPAQNGQAFKIKDACGTALSNNITVNAGGGYTIDGSQCATINTDYGALEIMFDGGTKWHTLSFVN